MNFPPIVSPDTFNWQDFAAIDVLECGSPLQKLPENARLQVHSAYFEQQFSGSLPDIYLRPEVIERLHIALQHLPEQFGLRVLDGWRAIETQMALRQSFLKQIQNNNPNLSAEEYQIILNQFVADPHRPNFTPPHNTGGSVDLTLFDMATGKTLFMGSEFDEPTPQSHTIAFEKLPENPAHWYRRILFHAMTQAGFSNLPSEWWHFDYGNKLWAFFRQQKHAIFGATSLS